MGDIHILEEDFPIYSLDCNVSYKNLSEREKLYSFALIKAGWYGALIDLLQCSPESPGLFLLAHKLFAKYTIQELKNLFDKLDYNEKDLKNFLNYFTMMYENLGNYRSFGDSKFIPCIEEHKFKNLITSSNLYKNDDQFRTIFNKIESSIYSLTPRNKQLGLGESGISTYYSLNCTMKDAELVQKYLDENNISGYNTRIFKSTTNGITEYEVRQASSLVNKEVILNVKTPVDGVVVKLVSGDYRELMQLMIDELKEAERLALNETERKMMGCYITSFETGSIEAHKEGSRYWVKDKKPIVENYIGFIESYRDPLGVKGEFEAFIAVVNKEMSAKFENLVNGATSILEGLPWPKQYEKDTFLQPDFTSLDIINFANSGIPVGINIPNYDDVRQIDGFKNVSLGNVLKSLFKDPKTNFIHQDDKEVFLKYVADAFEIQVGLHELIGHGSGKLFKSENGQLNFDVNVTKDILTNGPVTSWYKEGETWDSVFTTIASPYEECRAECVGIYMCSMPNVLEIFGHTNAIDASNIVYINWLFAIKYAMVSMEFYTPEQNKWRQAHCQAAFVILQVLLEAGEGFVNIENVIAEDGKPNIVVHLDGSKIETVGRPAIGKFLKLLQYYKSTANVTEGSTFFNKYSILDERFLQLRLIVLDRKLPRPAVVQSVLQDCEGIPKLLEYPNTPEGMIRSYQDRFPGAYGDKAIKALFDVWSRDWGAHFE